jgi:hypothetical protein
VSKSIEFGELRHHILTPSSKTSAAALAAAQQQTAACMVAKGPSAACPGQHQHTKGCSRHGVGRRVLLELLQQLGKAFEVVQLNDY